MLIQTIPDVDNKRDFLAETKDLPRMTATSLELVQSIDQLLEVSSSRGECGAEGMKEVLDDSAQLITSSTRVDDGKHLFEDGNQRARLHDFTHFLISISLRLI